MIKIIKILLIVCSMILFVFLGKNIHTYLFYKDNNEVIIKNTNNYEQKINDNIIQINNLNNELNALKEQNSEKIWNYDRWIKWNNEILEKIN